MSFGPFEKRLWEGVGLEFFGELVTVRGQRLSKFEVSMGVSAGGTGAEASVWVSETSTACM
eukprot:760387-Rhodomonas_salina.1